MAVEWDVKDVSCSIGGIEVTDFISFSYDNEVEITHIETVKGVVGYNKKYPKPKWTVKCRVDPDVLNQLQQWKNDKTVLDQPVTFKAPGMTINCLNPIITKIDVGDVGTENPEVTIEGLALKIEEKFS